ncbi:MAG: hypothetical protein L0Z62_12135 [Gemmataceae bacterium]|nr:hypothetical protein [Gemmataceae bacterium]
MSSPKILILYNEPVLPENHPDSVSETEILYTVDAVYHSLRAAGYEVVRLGVSHDPAILVSGLRIHRPDAVFNLFEGTGDHGHSEAWAAGVMQWFGVPFTGAPFEALCLARNKHLAKLLLRGAGLPTAEFFVVEDGPVPPCPLPWPVIVKPATQDSSVGLDQNSVVTNQRALEERVALLLGRYGPPVLVERYIAGREFAVPVVEMPDLRALPPAEITFIPQEGVWPIVTYNAKWDPDSADYRASPPRYPADVTPALGARLRELAEQAIRLLGCRDYARVDFRVDAADQPYILEVNPNPDFNPEAGLSGGLPPAGLTHAEFTLRIIRNALARGD